MIAVRRFRREDIAAIAELFRQTVRRVNSRDYSPEQVAAWAPDEIDEQGWAANLAGRYCLVAVMDDRIVGFGDLDGDDHLDYLYVHADHQRCGVGRLLLAALEAEAAQRGAHRVFTEASITARPFFERQGYRVLEEQVVLCRGVAFLNYRMAHDVR